MSDPLVRWMTETVRQAAREAGVTAEPVCGWDGRALVCIWRDEAADRDFAEALLTLTPDETDRSALVGVSARTWSTRDRASGWAREYGSARVPEDTFQGEAARALMETITGWLKQAWPDALRQRDSLRPAAVERDKAMDAFRKHLRKR